MILKKKILVIHPGGNFHSNPNLYSILQQLSLTNFIIDYLCLDFNGVLYQESEFLNLRVIKLIKNKIDKEYIKHISQCLHKDYDLVIATHDGIEAASIFTENYNLPLVLLSYEMTFKDEVGYVKQNILNRACLNIVLAISQDPVRSYLLSKEYSIPNSKIICIPVSGKSDYVKIDKATSKKRLNIDISKKVLLMAGSISERTEITKLINMANQLKNDWILLLNSYVPLKNRVKNQLRKKSKKIVLFDKPLPSITDLGMLFSIADIGIAINSPVYNSQYAQKNILFMGLSSGKISTYLKYGVPIIINEIGQMSDYVRFHKLGAVINSVEEVNTDLLDKIFNENLHNNCQIFFNRYLDFNLYASDLVDIFNEISCTQSVSIQSIKNINQKHSFHFSISALSQIETQYNFGKDIYNSPNYSLGRYLLHPVNTSKLIFYYIFRMLKRILYKTDLEIFESFNNVVKAL